MIPSNPDPRGSGFSWTEDAILIFIELIGDEAFDDESI
jgi:hypothetical protein